MSEAGFSFDLPDSASPQLEAVAQLAQLIDDLRIGTERLAREHVALRTSVRQLSEDNSSLRQRLGLNAKSTSEAPATVRWDRLDQTTAMAVWDWLIDRVQWLVERYGLHEDLGACWTQHPALIEELTALCLAWHVAYEGGPADAPLRWHESLDRARRRWRDWDRSSKCRLGQHTDRPPSDLWPSRWRDSAREDARADITARGRGATIDESATVTP